MGRSVKQMRVIVYQSAASNDGRGKSGEGRGGEGRDDQSNKVVCVYLSACMCSCQLRQDPSSSPVDLTRR